jgi:hypothetical protein
MKKKYTSLYFLVFVHFFLSAPDVSAQWHNANPGAGGQLQHVVCDPNVTGQMYLCSDMEGFYVSDDFGDHWEYKGWNSPFSFIFNIAIEPGNSNRLYLTSSQGIAISDDAGSSWQVIDQFKGMSVATIAVNPSDKNEICFAESWLESVIGTKNGAGKIYFSKNKGENWESSTFLNYTSNKNVYSINYHPSPDSKEIIIATDDGIFVSDNNYLSWKKIPSPANTTICQGCDFTPDGKWLYAVYIRKDGKTGVYVKNYESGEWQEPDPKGYLQNLSQTHWRPKVWSGSGERHHFVLFGVLKTGGDYNDNALNEGRFLVEGENIFGHVNQILKVKGAAEPFDVGWNAYWSHCRTYDYYPKNWEVEGVNRGVFAMSQQSTFRGDAAKPHDWVVNTCHLSDTKNLVKFYRTNGTASTWVWDIAGVKNYVVQGMGDNGIVESWNNGFSWTQQFAPAMWNVDALEVVKGTKTIVLAGRTDGFGGALAETKGWLYYREVDLNNPGGGWVEVINGKSLTSLKGLDPVFNRIATIQSDPHKPERVYIGTNSGLYVTDNIFELINNNPQYFFKSISQPVIGSTLTRRIHVDPNDENILYLRCWKGTYRIEKKEDQTYSFIKLKIAGSDQYLQDGWGHNGDITVWNNDTTTCLMVTRNMPADWELWISYDKGGNFSKILNKTSAFEIRAPGDWYSGQGPVIFGGLCGSDSLLFTSVHIRGGGDGLTKGFSFLKGTIRTDKSVIWEDFSGDPKKGGIWFPAARSGKIWEDGTGQAAIHLATMGAGMWKRSLADVQNAKAQFLSNVRTGNLPLIVEFDASASLPSETASEIIKYEWDFGDGKTGEGKIVSHEYLLENAFTAKLTVTDDMGNTDYAYSTIEGQVYVPVADFVASTYSGKMGHEIQFFGELSYDENPADSLVLYEWDFKDGTIKTGQNVTHTFTDWGRFNVKLTVKNSSLKSSLVTKSIVVELNTKAKEETINVLNVYPNPFTDKLGINLMGRAEIAVHNLMGQKIYSYNEFSDCLSIETSSWESGVYLLSVDQKGKIQFRKIIRQ